MFSIAAAGGEDDDEGREDEEAQPASSLGDRDAVASVPPDGPEDDEEGGTSRPQDGDEDEIEHSATIREDKAPHIFRKSHGHIERDTVESRQLLEGTVTRNNFLGTDSLGGSNWYARLLPDGRQIWVQVRNGQIRNAGINDEPYVFDPSRGMVHPTIP